MIDSGQRNKSKIIEKRLDARPRPDWSTAALKRTSETGTNTLKNQICELMFIPLKKEDAANFGPGCPLVFSWCL